MPSIINSTNIKHPNTFSISQGTTLLVKEISAINQSIKLILTTAKGELFGDPEFGSRLHELLYEFAGDSLTLLIKREIVDSLSKFETRIFIEEDDISVSYYDKSAVIDISYNLKYTDYRTSYRYIAEINREES